MDSRPYKTTEIVNLFMIDRLVLFYNNIHYLSGGSKQAEQHEHYELYYIESGYLTLGLGSGEVRLMAGQSFLMAPRTPHRVIDRAPLTLLKLCGFMCRGDLLLPLCGKPFELSGDEQVLLSELAAEGQQCFERLPTRSSELGCQVRPGISRGRLQALKNKLEIFLIKLIESRLGNKPPSKRVTVADAVYEYLSAHVADRVTLEQIAGTLSLSVSYIKREFFKKYGRGIIDCLLDMKIDRAKQLIEETSLNFTQIAEYLSFESENHFSKTFSKRTGRTPSAYLKETQGK